MISDNSYTYMSESFIHIDIEFVFYLKTEIQIQKIKDLLFKNHFFINTIDFLYEGRGESIKHVINCTAYIKRKNVPLIRECYLDFNKLILNVKNPDEEIQLFCETILKLKSLENENNN